MRHPNQYRNLRLVREGGSSLRVIDFFILHKRANRLYDSYSGRAAKPLFHSPILRRSMIIKHVVRSNEKDFHRFGTIITKLIFPFDADTLENGGYMMPLEDRLLLTRLEHELVNLYSESARRDIDLLKLISEQPSLDPFIIRSAIEQNSIDVNIDVLDISDSEFEKIQAEIRREIILIAQMAMGSDYDKASVATSRITDGFMSSQPHLVLTQLMSALEMSAEEFDEAIYSWKLIIYYHKYIEQIVESANEIIIGIADSGLKYKSRTLNKEIGKRKRMILHDYSNGAIKAARIMGNARGMFSGFIKNGNVGEFKLYMQNLKAETLKIAETLHLLTHIKGYYEHYKSTHEMHCLSVDQMTDFVSGLEAHSNKKDIYTGNII